MQQDNYPSGLEDDLNMVIQDLVTGLDDLANKIEGGGERGDIASLLRQLASSICDHWPDCRDKTSKGS